MAFPHQETSGQNLNCRHTGRRFVMLCANDHTIFDDEKTEGQGEGGRRERRGGGGKRGRVREQKVDICRERSRSAVRLQRSGN